MQLIESSGLISATKTSVKLKRKHASSQIFLKFSLLYIFLHVLFFSCQHNRLYFFFWGGGAPAILPIAGHVLANPPYHFLLWSSSFLWLFFFNDFNVSDYLLILFLFLILMCRISFSTIFSHIDLFILLSLFLECYECFRPFSNNSDSTSLNFSLEIFLSYR